MVANKDKTIHIITAEQRPVIRPRFIAAEDNRPGLHRDQTAVLVQAMTFINVPDDIEINIDIPETAHVMVNHSYRQPLIRSTTCAFLLPIATIGSRFSRALIFRT